MRHLALLGLISLAAVTAATTGADAQSRRRTAVVIEENGPPVLRVRPRSFLDAGRAEVLRPASALRLQLAQDGVAHLGGRNRVCARPRDVLGARARREHIG